MGKIKTLKPEEGVFGQMMWAYYNGREICEIVRGMMVISQHIRLPMRTRKAL